MFVVGVSTQNKVNSELDAGFQRLNITTCDIESVTTSELDCVLFIGELAEASYMRFIELREEVENYILVMTQEKSIQNKQFYLHLGADVVFHQGEEELLLLTLKNAIKRKGKLELNSSMVLPEIGEGNSYALDHSSFQLIDDKTKDFVQFTRKEFKLFKILYERQNTIVLHEELIFLLWEDNEEVQLTSLANLVFRTRGKLTDVFADEVVIKVIRSRGYKLVC